MGYKAILLSLHYGGHEKVAIILQHSSFGLQLTFLCQTATLATLEAITLLAHYLRTLKLMDLGA